MGQERDDYGEPGAGEAGPPPLRGLIRTGLAITLMVALTIIAALYLFVWYVTQ